MKKMRASGDRAEESDGGRSAAAVDPSDTALAHGDDLPVRGGSNCGVASNCDAKLRRVVEIAELGHMSVDKAVATLMAIRGNRGAAAVLSYLKDYGDSVQSSNPTSRRSGSISPMQFFSGALSGSLD